MDDQYNLDNNHLHYILSQWNMQSFHKRLVDKNIDAQSLVYLTEHDLGEIFFPDELGAKVVFRQCLKVHRKNLNIDVPIDTDPTELVKDFIGKFKEKVYDSIDNISQISSAPSSPRSSSVYSPLLSPQNSGLSFDLETFLESEEGKSVIDAYESNNYYLPNFAKEILITGIVKYFTQKKVFMHNEEFVNISDQICERFKHENKVFYYSFNGKYKTGRLYTCYKNSVSKLRKHSLFPREKQPRKQRKLEEPCSTSTLFDTAVIDDVEIIAKQTWLKHHRDPWCVVEANWMECFSLRLSQIKAAENKTLFILKEWPLYAHSDGSRLVDLDFEKLFPGTICNLISEWNNFASHIFPIFKDQIKDKFILKELHCFEKQDHNLDSKNVAIWKFLHAVLVPKGQAKDKASKKIWKFSILDSQESSILHVKVFNDYKLQLDKRRDKYYKYGITCQPIVVVVGETIHQLTSFYSVYEDVYYKYNTFLEALSTTFKIHYIFDLEYQIESKLVWEFLQQYFFKIKDAYSSTALSKLLSTLDECV